MIGQHIAPSLSALDLEMVRHVPQGGNWKDIPESVPSARLAQIRRSFEAGEGSRSTYYGRLRPDAPAYTINTYFTRPGNGCHVHYTQDRVLTYREAARLQAFPDTFLFEGSRAAVARQIGNAVPPLLAYQIALALGPAGGFVDLFAGAGGLSLGFMWAGWDPAVATDIDKASVATYARNVHKLVVPGDIRDPVVFNEVIAVARRARSSASGPFWVIGGPPCQGFSTAGNPRSLSDDRNGLFLHYRDALQALRPDGFVFENVLGLLNMHQGAVLELIERELQSVGYVTRRWLLRAEEYAVPQRRHRLLIVGVRDGAHAPNKPEAVTNASTKSRIPAYTVEEALSDLPALKAGDDGTCLEYVAQPLNSYQLFLRAELGPGGLLAAMRRGHR